MDESLLPFLQAASVQSRVAGDFDSGALDSAPHRPESGERVHQSSVVTLLERVDSDDASTGASYLELADDIVQRGGEVR